MRVTLGYGVDADRVTVRIDAEFTMGGTALILTRESGEDRVDMAPSGFLSLLGVGIDSFVEALDARENALLAPD